MDEITLALAKGRTAEHAINFLEQAGYTFPDLLSNNRKLIFFDQEYTVKLILVKADDVPTYVEKGAADIGIAGKDHILEAGADIYEILDLKLGECQFVISGKPDTDLNSNNKVVIASKYPEVAKRHFKKQGIPAELIKLNGSVELAPLIGLSDVIVDIMETGATLRENGLVVLDQIEAISTRLIVNKASFTTKSKDIHTFINNLKRVME
ncbi:ATP phosphoribosyltransferase [Lentibacillus sp. JNUCC-1]|uniref:ATP phosphoribosyltransferase n=1 Tax=Lentibacillus sp. JNUCC-1 TaxID=2654513 RepID=UPI0012E86C83|nr:ATP phosphoribosyltransferase [Lentibacillus sp. JNUCC-1]MUV38621.1 ATP phosphoribosyltransferase [Lentibacillus sp. JNUCC-1]